MAAQERIHLIDMILLMVSHEPTFSSPVLEKANLDDIQVEIRELACVNYKIVQNVHKDGGV